jgi:hypothetical protein
MFYTSASRPGDGKEVKRDPGSWSGKSQMRLGRELNPGWLLLEPGLCRSPIVAQEIFIIFHAVLFTPAIVID